MTTDTPVPARVSNGRLIEQMLLWGWTLDKSHGDMVLMKHPLTRHKIDVRAATYHKGNPTSTIREVYSLTTESDAGRFWARTAPLTEVAAEAYAAALPEIHPIAPPPGPRLPNPGTRDESGTPPGLVADPAPELKDPPRVIKNRGLTNKVFEAMLREQRPTSARQLAVRLGHDAVATASALSYLYGKDLLERVKQGFYQLPDALRTEDMRVIHRIIGDLNEGLPLEHVRMVMAHHADPPERVITEAKINAVSIEAEGTPGTSLTVLASEPKAVQDVVAALAPDPDPRDRDAPPMAEEDVDDLIDTVLDMMFPDGFKARHRRTVEAWAEATCKLIVEVGT